MRLAQIVFFVMAIGVGNAQPAVSAPADDRISCWEPDGDLFIDCDQNQAESMRLFAKQNTRAGQA